jgi:NAD-dependent deacetylase
VVWFGEPIDPEVLDQSLAATACDLFLTIGTSALVHPAASLVNAAREHGAFTAEINLEATSASSLVDLVLQGRAEELLDEIEAARPAS